MLISIVSELERHNETLKAELKKASQREHSVIYGMGLNNPHRLFLYR